MLKKLRLRSDAQGKRETKYVTLAPGDTLGLKYECTSTKRGPCIVDIEVGSAADRAGLAVGQVILSVGGRRTAGHEELLAAIKALRAAGGQHAVEVAAARSLPSTPLSRPALKPRAMTNPPTSSVLSQASDALARSFSKNLLTPLLKATDVRSTAAAMPKTYEVVCPSQPDIEGTFSISPTRLNGAPVWHAKDGRRLYCTKSGLWALVDCADGPERNIALVSSRRQGRGRAPHTMHWAEWQCWDGQQWMACPVRIEELRVDLVDGRHYWKGAFVEYYGQEMGLRKWQEAAQESNVFADSASEAPSTRDGLTDDGSEHDDVLTCLSLSRTASTYEPPTLSVP